MKEFLAPVDVLYRARDHSLQKMKETPHLGRKLDPGLSYLIAVAIFVACRVAHNCDYKLPSPYTKQFNIENYPLLAFIHSIVTLAADKGIKAIGQSTGLTPERDFCGKQITQRR